MILAEAIEAVRELVVEAPPGMADSRPLAAVAYDSRRVVPAALFVALKGLKADGAAFAEQALARGAQAVIAETPAPAGVAVPWIIVRDARLALALLADRFFESPSRRMPVIGVTGTNGKTTTAYLLTAMLDQAGLRSGMLGTVAYRIGSEDREASRTTPEAPDVQQLLSEMLRHGNKSAVMEVSSHALSLKRVDGMRFAAGVFSNLTRDHLDFHEDMEAYFAAKRRLFEMLPRDAPGVINMDDPRGPALVEICGRPVTYAINAPAEVRPGPVAMTLNGLRFDIVTPQGTVHLQSKLVGRPNVYNILAATATAVSLGAPIDAIERGVAGLAGVPGRFEVVSGVEDDVTAVVDYAHTDDALRNLLETARPLSARRLVTVFGCGGDRDRSKRPLMGMVAARLSDVVVITSDNPRSEDPKRIIEEIERGIPAGSQSSPRTPTVVSAVDRAEAIDRAIAMAEAGDVVLIAGKGHEKYQQVGDRVLPFDDGEVARAALGEAPSDGREGQLEVAAEIPLAAGAMAAAMGGRLVAGDSDHYVTGFSIDSRTLATGDLFFAIVAARDGHEFIGAAARRRAAGVVVDRQVRLPDDSDSFVIEVADTTRGLQDLARHVRRESGATVVAITGSAGKTTTKDVIAEFLGGGHRVVKNRGNLNNHLGLPLSLLELRHGADVAVMELGMNHAGEIRVLVDVATPEVRVWTNVGEAHIGHFGTADGIADAKAEILEDASAATTLVANADDDRVMARTGRFPGRQIRFGLSERADVRAVDVEDLGLDGTKSRLITPAGERGLHVPLLGRGHLMNVLAGAAVALHMDVALDQIVDSASRLTPSSKRGATLRLPKGVIVIDDLDNSSPSALKQSLDVLSRTWATRRVAVIGEMLELGDLSLELHQECGRTAAASRLSRLLTVGGPSARALGDAAIAAGLTASTVTHFDSSAEAAAAIHGQVASGDVVLVKGSRGTRTDVVVEQLMAVFS